MDEQDPDTPANEQCAFEVTRRGAENLLTCGHIASNRDHPNARVRNERRANTFTAAADDVYDSLGEQLEQMLPKLECSQRSLL